MCPLVSRSAAAEEWRMASRAAVRPRPTLALSSVNAASRHSWLQSAGSCSHVALQSSTSWLIAGPSWTAARTSHASLDGSR